MDLFACIAGAGSFEGRIGRAILGFWIVCGIAVGLLLLFGCTDPNVGRLPQ